MSSIGTPAAQVFSLIIFQVWKCSSTRMFLGHVNPLTMFKQSSSAPAPTPTPAPTAAPTPVIAPAPAVSFNPTPVPEVSPAMWVVN